MDASELKKIAVMNRSMREAGIALISTSLLLALFLFVPYAKVPEATEAPTTQAATTPTDQDAFAQVLIDAKAAIVYDLATGETLYAKNADAQLPLASLTKLLTVHAALTRLSPDTAVTSSGQTFSLSDLSRLTLTASLNDGADAILETASTRSSRSQNEELAAAVASLNLSQTYAVNGSGLDVSDTNSGGYGSARDVAHLAGALVQLAPDIAHATTRNAAEAVTDTGEKVVVRNTNPMVDSVPHLLLSKTGYTDLAGGNLALVFDVGIGHPVAVVVLGSTVETRFTDSMVLLAATFAHFAGVPSL